MKKLNCFYLSILIFVSSPSFAYECVGKVNHLVIAPTGVVTASLGGIYWANLCSVNVSYNSVDPEACKTVYSSLLAAKLAEKNVRLWFNDASNDCTNTKHPAWTNLQGWYFGPNIE